MDFEPIVQPKKKGNIFVAVPMYGGMCTGYFTQSMLTLGPVLNQNGYDMAFSAMFNESLIQRGRNALAHGFMKRPECTHLMFIDADIKFNPQDIIKMIEADKDIICGIYPKKEINWVEVEKAVKEGVPSDKLKTRTASVVVNLKDYAGSVTVPVNEPVEIFNGGTGFMLIKRNTFEVMKSVVNSYNNDVLFLDGGISNDRITEYFSCAIEPGTERLLSEDYFFCWKAREAGLKVWAAPWAQLGHFGSYLFEGGLTPAP
jgi:hypothetical protein